VAERAPAERRRLDDERPVAAQRRNHVPALVRPQPDQVRNATPPLLHPPAARLVHRPHVLSGRRRRHSTSRRNRCAVTASAYRPTDRYRPHMHAKSVIFLQFDAIFCTFICGCERRSLCAKRMINNIRAIRYRKSIRVSWVRVSVTVRVSCRVVRGRYSVDRHIDALISHTHQICRQDIFGDFPVYLVQFEFTGRGTARHYNFRVISGRLEATENAGTVECRNNQKFAGPGK